jgi:hypothetical protein
MAGRGRFLRENVFLIAAVSLPLVVVGFFLIASIVPRWLVPPPAYDLLLRAAGPPDHTRRGIVVDFTVRDGRVQAVVQTVAPGLYLQPLRLFLVEHQTMNVREIPVDVPANLPEKDPATIAVTALAGRRVLAQTKAPDGYEFQTRRHGSAGLVQGLFGMDRYGERVSLVNRGRVVPIPLSQNEYSYYGIALVGWVVNEGSR